MEMTFEEKIRRIRVAVHSELDFSDYDSTSCQVTCNCYSHAMGSTLPFNQTYRIGAICGKKPIDADYTSTEELLYLLYEDFRVLDLGIIEYKGEELYDNQYLIEFYIKSYLKGYIFDYHFTRCDNNVWTEKWRNRKAMEISKNYYNFFPWNIVGTYKITKVAL